MVYFLIGLPQDLWLVNRIKFNSLFNILACFFTISVKNLWQTPWKLVLKDEDQPIPSGMPNL